jgi:rare lipoprotein A
VFLTGWLAATLAIGLLAGCGHRENVEELPAPEAAPPPVQSQPPVHPATHPSTPSGKPSPAHIAPTPAPPGGVSAGDLEFVRAHKPILTEEGLATWYTAAKGRKSANGDLFSNQSLTAAHRTLPMGSLIVVTNLTTGQSSPMRITDRGPFVEGRILDLTIASANATGIYKMGTANVRLDLYRAPKPVSTGGRWCVQIGAFTSQRKADKLKAQLERKFTGAKVIEFPGEDVYWVRIRPAGDNRELAESIARKLRPAEGAAFLTRLD